MGFTQISEEYITVYCVRPKHYAYINHIVLDSKIVKSMQNDIDKTKE